MAARRNVTAPEREAAGVKAVMVALQRGLKFMGVFRTADRLRPGLRLA
jgi:hypothetical protein